MNDWVETVCIAVLIGCCMMIASLMLALLLYVEATSPPCKRYSEPRLVLIPILVGKVMVQQPHWIKDCLEREGEKK